MGRRTSVTFQSAPSTPCLQFELRCCHTEIFFKNSPPPCFDCISRKTVYDENISWRMICGPWRFTEHITLTRAARWWLCWVVCWLLWGSLLFGRPDIFKVLHTGAYHLPTPGQHIRANRDRVLRSSLTDAKDLEGKLCYASLLLHVTRPWSLPDAAAKMQLMEWILNVKKFVVCRS